MRRIRPFDARWTRRAATLVITIAVAASGSVAAAAGAQAAPIGPRFTLSAFRTNGAWDVDRTFTYEVTAIAKTRPEYIDAAPSPHRPSGNDLSFEREGTTHGQGVWQLGVTMDKKLASHRYWNIGVRTGSTLHVIKLRVFAPGSPNGFPTTGSTHHA